MVNAAAVEIDITPPVGTGMTGYMARTQASIGIHDPLKAQVLFIEAGKSAVLIVTMDLLAVQASFSDRLRTSISRAAGIPESHIMLSCSHTHSGPQGFNLDNTILQEKEDDSLQEITLRKITGACTWAKTLLQPVKFSLGHSLGSGVGLNRNDPLTGPSDQQVTVLRIDDLDGNPLAVLFNYGCHPTIMGASNLFISADYPGAARKALQEIFKDTVFLFTNSSAGDVSTRFTRKEAAFNEVDRLGQIMAGAVLQAMNTAEGFEVEQVTARLEAIDLPVKKLPTVEGIESIILSVKQELEQLEKAGASAAEKRKLVTKIEGGEMLLIMVKELAGKTSLPASIQLIRIGTLSLAGVPGEPFSKTFLDIKEQIQPEQAILIGYANDYKGYFPESKPGQPTYEDLISPFSFQAAINIKDTIIKMIKDLKDE